MTMNATKLPVLAWTRLNIRLHWLIVGLIVLQYVSSEWMEALFDKGSGAGTSTIVIGYSHMIIGAIIFFATAVRLWDRAAHGRPPHDSEAPYWTVGLARVVHFLLYALLITMPIIGGMAYFTNSEFFATAHDWEWTMLVIAAGIHVLGALVNHFWFHSDALRRMMPGRARTADLRKKS